MNTELRKDGLYTKDWEYDEEKEEGEYVYEKLDTIFDAMKYLNYVVEVEEGVTLKHLYETFSEADMCVLGLLCDSNIEAYQHELYVEPEEPERDDVKLTHILISKYYEINDLGQYETPPTKDNHIEDNVHVTGKAKDDELNYALSYTHWGHLKDLPIIIEEEAVLFDNRKFWNEDHTALNKGYKPERFKATITLFELYHSIFFELCWNGTPGNRISFLKDLDERCQDAKDHPENLIPWEDVKEKLGI